MVERVSFWTVIFVAVAFCRDDPELGEASVPTPLDNAEKELALEGMKACLLFLFIYFILFLFYLIYV